jgi:hypothetical protein
MKELVKIILNEPNRTKLAEISRGFIKKRIALGINRNLTKEIVVEWATRWNTNKELLN